MYTRRHTYTRTCVYGQKKKRKKYRTFLCLSLPVQFLIIPGSFSLTSPYIVTNTGTSYIIDYLLYFTYVLHLSYMNYMKYYISFTLGFKQLRHTLFLFPNKSVSFYSFQRINSDQNSYIQSTRVSFLISRIKTTTLTKDVIGTIFVFVQRVYVVIYVVETTSSLGSLVPPTLSLSFYFLYTNPLRFWIWTPKSFKSTFSNLRYLLVISSLKRRREQSKVFCQRNLKQTNTGRVNQFRSVS